MLNTLFEREYVLKLPFYKLKYTEKGQFSVEWCFLQSHMKGR